MYDAVLAEREFHQIYEMQLWSMNEMMAAATEEEKTKINN